ncbi:unnamed protein product [Linum trigynum]|uniref:Uncharacterized protein n=1 Tax=Linum trigynum TaxID=586398 RepID=A0AAV2G9Z1_9ROSI
MVMENGEGKGDLTGALAGRGSPKSEGNGDWSGEDGDGDGSGEDGDGAGEAEVQSRCDGDGAGEDGEGDDASCLQALHEEEDGE